MTYVVDASTAFKWVVSEADSDKAIQLRDDYRNGVHALLAPDIFPAEIANAFLVAERMGRVAGFAVALLDVLTTCPTLNPTIPLLSPATAVIAKIRVSLYDALYVALAEREKCDLITGDKKLVRIAHKQFPFVKYVGSLP
jgi:predicted nucleic acid-binding protein